MQVMMFPGLAVLVLILVGAVVLCCVLKPVAGRVLARVFSVVAVGVGAGLLVWGICAASLGEPEGARFGMGSVVGSPSEAIGWGAGFLVAGIMALVLSFVGGCVSRRGPSA